jgi:DNA-binding transcriptional LysR family regulator
MIQENYMKYLNRVHLNGLRAAEATARLRAQHAAAEELGVSVGAVSQHVIKLEGQIGRRLFERTRQGLRATTFGERFLARVGSGLAEIDRALADAFDDDGVLTLSVAPVFAAKWLVPRLTAFSRLHPAIRVRVDASVALKQPDETDVDVAIRVGDGHWPEVCTEFLLSQEVFPVCSPEIASALRRPEDLSKVPIVRDMNSMLDWSLWLDQFGIPRDAIAKGHEFTDASLALDAAIAGHGAMLAWQTLAHDALAEGRLVAPFPERAATGLGYWIVTSAFRRQPEKVRLFIEWLHREMPK